MNFKKTLLLIIGFSSLAIIVFLVLFLTDPQAQMPATVTITGRVYNTGTSEPINMAIVFISADGFHGSDFTDNTGRYSISDCPTGHELTLRCRKTGYKPFNTTLPTLTEITSLTAFTYDIALTGLISGDIGYGQEDQPTIIYSIERDDRDSEYAPGVIPKELEEETSEEETAEEETEEEETTEEETTESDTEESE